ncbi:hypothetical protein [Candidatus Ichthyocystis hellenicum]|uniref:hypothetical protein n=1 Tax=Candidatus Ichthyocystis hellenicum TaxID=1561003 RepID=UPI001112BF92|nr:hypothetical protein [Candidatus Ichthyocystis hellenicum]
MNVSRNNHDVGATAIPDSTGYRFVPTYYGDGLPRVSLKLLTQNNCGNYPTLSIVKMREATSVSMASMRRVIKVRIVPKIYMNTDEESTYLVIISSPMSAKPTNDSPQPPSAKVIPFMTNSHGESPSMSLIGVANVELKTSVKLEVKIGSTISQYALLVDALPQVHIESLTQHNSSDLPIMSIANIRRTPRLGTSITVELAPRNASIPMDGSVYNVIVNPIIAASVYKNFKQFSLVDIMPLIKNTSSQSPSLSLIDVTRMGLKTLIKLEATVETTKNQYRMIVEEPHPTLPESSSSA